MATITISPKYEITIPEELRKSLDWKPGQKVELVRHGERIELIPARALGGVSQDRIRVKTADYGRRAAAFP